MTKNYVAIVTKCGDFKKVKRGFVYTKKADKYVMVDVERMVSDVNEEISMHHGEPHGAPHRGPHHEPPHHEPPHHHPHPFGPPPPPEPHHPHHDPCEHGPHHGW